MTAAAIAAVFSDWRTVKSRKMLQLVFEVPLEQQAEVLTMLGAPLPDNPKWCGIALMNSPAGPSTQKRKDLAATEPSPGKDTAKPAGELQRARYAAMSAGEQAVVRAAMLCSDERFRAWVAAAWGDNGVVIADEDDAANFIRNRCCGGNSRKLIAEVPEYLDRFLAMELDFRIAVGEVAAPR